MLSIVSSSSMLLLFAKLTHCVACRKNLYLCILEGHEVRNQTSCDTSDYGIHCP